MSGIQNLLLSGSPQVADDSNFNQVTLLLPGNGTNGAQNNTFLDSSTNNFTITRNGNTTQGTFSPFSLPDGQWSNYFDGNGDYLDLGNTAVLPLTGDYTVECWYYHITQSTDNSFIFLEGNTSAYAGCRLEVLGSAQGANVNKMQFLVSTSGSSWAISSGAISGSDLTPNAWNHVAVVRNGGTHEIFVNGTSVYTSTTVSSGTSLMNGTLNYIGAYNFSGATRFLAGYLSNYRVVSGTAVYTSAFTPPTTPLTAITNTSLLTCQSNRFVDNSTNAFTITRNGDVRVTAFSPFAPTAAYDAGTNGGSGYFDGTGDYLSVARNSSFLPIADEDFTFEAWVYPLGTPGVTLYQIAGLGEWGTDIDWGLFVNASLQASFYLHSFGGFYTNTTTSVRIGAWNHIAVSRSGTGSNNLKVFVNGVGQSFSSNLTTVGTGNRALTIGADQNGDESNVLGYISDLRLVKGTAVYTANFTPPTAPLTAITNTSLLLNFTNAGIIDASAKNDLETVGNAQIDTAVSKFGGGSIEFDGTGDWLLMPNTPDQQLGTGNFTIEFWVYLATGDTGSARGLVAKGTSTTGLLVSLDSSQKVVFTYTTSTITSSGAITLDAWNHIAVVREGTGSNQTKIYINGTNDGTGTVSTDFNQTSVMYVGANRTGGDPMKGFIDDLRITKGVARYTANFTPPTAPFPLS